jgi:hypothetical protein
MAVPLPCGRGTTKIRSRDGGKEQGACYAAFAAAPVDDVR